MLVPGCENCRKLRTTKLLLEQQLCDARDRHLKVTQEVDEKDQQIHQLKCSLAETNTQLAAVKKELEAYREGPEVCSLIFFCMVSSLSGTASMLNQVMGTRSNRPP